MAVWRDTTIGELLEVKHGFAFLGQYFSDAGTHVVLTPGNFHERGGFRAKGEKEKWYTGPVPDDYVLRRGDILVAMTEQAEGLLGSSAVIPRDGIYLHNQRLGLLQIRDADPGFVFYLFNTTHVREQVRASATGVKVRHTSPSRIAAVRVRIPDRKTQVRIAGILSAYDDLIENCERRIRVLDEMARSLYREWFVDFRLGDRWPSSPTGWESKSVKEVAEVQYGMPFKSALFTDDGTLGKALVRIRDVPAGQSFTYTPEPADPRYEIHEGDVLVGMDGDFHTTVWNGGPALLNQRVARFRARGNWSPLHLFLLLQEPITRLNRSIVGTTVAHLGDSHIREIMVLLPPEALLRAAFQSFEPVRLLSANLAKRVRTLRATRDLLLPRLLSGQLSVDDAA